MPNESIAIAPILITISIYISNAAFATIRVKKYTSPPVVFNALGELLRCKFMQIQLSKPSDTSQVKTSQRQVRDERPNLRRLSDSL